MLYDLRPMVPGASDLSSHAIAEITVASTIGAIGSIPGFAESSFGVMC